MATSVESQFAVALESTWGTASAGTYYPLRMTRDEPETKTETTELDLATGQVGAEPEIIAGARRGSFTLKGPIEVFKSGWDGTVATPFTLVAGALQVSPMIPLLCHALGSMGDQASTNAEFFEVKTGVWSRIVAYAVNGITAAGTDSTHIEVDALAAIKAGCLLSGALSTALTNVQLGFAKSAAANVVALYDTSKNTVASNDAELWPTATAWGTIVERKGLTFRYRGNDTAHCTILTGCCPEMVTLRFPAGLIPEVEIKYRAAGWVRDTSLGGLTTPAAMVRCAALTNEGDAQLTMGTPDGVFAAATAKCGVVDPEISIENVLTEIPCHGSGSQGISAYRVDRQKIRVKFKIAWDSTDAIFDAAGVALGAPGEGIHKWEASIRDGTKFSLAVFGGAAIGRIFAALVPSFTVEDVKFTDVLGQQGFEVTGRGATYSGDSAITGETAADSPMNSLVRFAWG